MVSFYLWIFSLIAYRRSDPAFPVLEMNNGYEETIKSGIKELCIPSPRQEVTEETVRQQLSFHMRALNPPSIAFSSPEGRKLFEQSLREGYLEVYFALAEKFTTQSDPAFCGLGSLSMALNALFIDPRRVWKGSWRWFDDSMLDCCVSLDDIRSNGITLPNLICLAKCNGAQAHLKYASELTLDEFREVVKGVCSKTLKDLTILLVSYSRKRLNQTGDGHFSPVGGYNRESDMVLIMDVARFKYPPHWVPLSDLYEAMKPIDRVTGKSRGYILLSRSEAPGYQCDCVCQCRNLP